MGVSSKWKEKAAVVAAKVARKEARRSRRDESQRLSLQEASVQNHPRLLQPRRHPYAGPPQYSHSGPVQYVDADAVPGAGVVARLKAFLSLRGFKTSGIDTAQALSGPARTHRDRRLLANAEVASRQQQLPKLTTVPRPSPQVKGSKVKVGRAAKSQAAQRPGVPRLLRRKRFQHAPVTIRLASIDKLRRDLGLATAKNTSTFTDAEDAVYVAIDTEGSYDATEIGISTLDTRDIAGIKPDYRAANWISKIKHQHIVIQKGANLHPSHHASRLNTALFCSSQLDTPANARALLLSRLQLARKPKLVESPRKVHLVGQSISGDISVLKNSPSMALDLSHGFGADFVFDSIYDTYNFSVVARDIGANFGSMQLGSLARALGVDPKYWASDSVIGCHNASNDAAYTLMVMLLFAVRWPTLSRDIQPFGVSRSVRDQLKVDAAPDTAKAREAISERNYGSKVGKKALKAQVLQAREARRKTALGKTWQQTSLLEKARLTLSALLWGRGRYVIGGKVYYGS